MGTSYLNTHTTNSCPLLAIHCLHNCPLLLFFVCSHCARTDRPAATSAAARPVSAPGSLSHDASKNSLIITTTNSNAAARAATKSSTCHSTNDSCCPCAVGGDMLWHSCQPVQLPSCCAAAAGRRGAGSIARGPAWCANRPSCTFRAVQAVLCRCVNTTGEVGRQVGTVGAAKGRMVQGLAQVQ